MDMISIFGFQDEFFIIIDNLNPMRNYVFHFAPGPRRFSTQTCNALLRSRYYCTAIFSGCNCPYDCWWWWYSVTVRICISWATFAFILPFFSQEKNAWLSFLVLLERRLRIKIVFFWYTRPSSRHSFAFEIHPIYDVIFKTYRFNWVNLVIYRCGLRSAFGTAFWIVRFFIFESCTDRNATLELKVFEAETVLVIRTYVIGWF